MKKLLCMLAIISCFCFAKCRKDKEPELPPVTTTGAMTFGCKINGKVFVPQDGRGKPGLYCQYVNLGNGPGGGWFLNIPANNYPDNSAVSIQTDSLLLVEGGIYEFKKQKNGYPTIWFEKSQGGVTKIFGKLDSDSGLLSIIKHDLPNRILSGTFYFTGTNVATGEKLSVTDGRFDIRY